MTGEQPDYPMTRKPATHAAAADLRRRAEARLSTQQAAAAAPRTEADTKRLFHELQVHQVELEMQNAELGRAQAEAEASAEKFSDLYDSAPVGYFTFAEQGRILGVNLTGAAFLEVERRRVLNRHFQLWVAPQCRPVFEAFLKRTFHRGMKQTCEVELLRNASTNVPVQIEGSRVPPRSGEAQCRAVVMDLTERKRAEEEVRRLNAELEDRVAARTAEVRSLLEQSRHTQQQLRRLSHQVLRTQEEERKRISRELHDQIAQVLIRINLDLLTLTRKPPARSRDLKQQVARTQRLVEDSVNTLHQFIRELRPPVLDDLGLIPALRGYLKDFGGQTGVRVSLATFTLAKIEALNSAKRSALYRVAQEALTNVAKHAEASRVKVRIQKLGDAIRMEIRDNGKSFDTKRERLTHLPKRLGLVGMKERVEMVGGNFSIKSEAGKGTTIQVQVPLGDSNGADQFEGIP